MSDAAAGPDAGRQAREALESWAHWESTRHELRAITDRIVVSPEERQELLTALDRSHAALAAWLVLAHRPESTT